MIASSHKAQPLHAQSTLSAAALLQAQQPFAVRVHPDVAFLCDVHAHLADAEIIGLLGGRWDAKSRVVYVQAPFPCRSAPREDDGATDVEMDPTSEASAVEARASRRAARLLGGARIMVRT